MNKKWLLLLLTVAMVVWATSAWAAEIKLFGAASAVDRMAKPYQAVVEKQTGVLLSIVTSNAGKGLISLVDGQCDAALVSAPLDTVVKGAKALGREIDASKLIMTVVARDEIVFIVHPSNPVKNLTWDQLRDIHTGKIVNWKEVGGNDSPILVFTDAEASATRGMIKQVVMGGMEYSPASKTLDQITMVNDMVAATPNGIGGLGKGFAKQGQVRIVESKKIERPLGFITIGEPSGSIKKVIDAYREAASNK